MKSSAASRRVSIRAIATVVFALAAACWPAAGPAQLPPLPPRIADVLEQFGIKPPDGESPLLGDWRKALEPPETNPGFVQVMERARRQDVVLPLDHALFDSEQSAAGHWHSEFYLAHYGTALFLAAPYDPARIPVVLVHGIGGSPRDFGDLLKHFGGSRYQPVFFLYPSGMPLAGAARQLGARLEEFVERHHVARFAVVAHSMGGLVAKGLLDEIDVADDLQSWRLLVSVSSPFAGVDSAQYAGRLPHHPPAWDDLAGRSKFLQKVQQTRFPGELGFYMLFSARSSRPLMAALGNNDGVLTLDAMLGSPVNGQARDVFGFYEDHVSILAAPLMYRRLDQILDAELGG